MSSTLQATKRTAGSALLVGIGMAACGGGQFTHDGAPVQTTSPSAASSTAPGTPSTDTPDDSAATSSSGTDGDFEREDAGGLAWEAATSDSTSAGNADGAEVEPSPSDAAIDEASRRADASPVLPQQDAETDVHRDADVRRDAEADVYHDADASPDAGDARCGEDSLCVFTTRQLTAGSLGGLAGADALCQKAAASASLPGTYRAWLGSGSDAPVTRFTISELPYVRVDGVMVAENWAALTSGQLSAPINRSELGVAVAGQAWTCVDRGGTLPATPFDCSGFTEDTASAFGLYGQVGMTDMTWTASDRGTCSGMKRLYCFEQ